jgi:ABC-2 type transport system permease protein
VALISLVQLTIIMGVAILWFGIPFRGSILALLVAATIYIVAGLAFGLVISSISRTQQEAIMVMFLFIMPAIILSGFMFPVFTMPTVFQWITLANPIRHFLEIVRPVFLKGSGIADLWPQYLWLLALAATALLTARWRFGKAGNP